MPIGEVPCHNRLMCPVITTTQLLDSHKTRHHSEDLTEKSNAASGRKEQHDL